MSELDSVFGKNESKLVFGKYRAIVKNIKDPEKLGRIQVQCAEIYGEDLSPWAWPCGAYGGYTDIGIIFIPEVNSGTWIEFEQGHVTNPIYSGCWWTKYKGTNEMPQNLQDNYGDYKVIKTKSGHSIEFYDKQGEEKIVITDAKGSIITLEDETVSVLSSGIISLESKDGCKILLSDKVEFESKDGSKISLSNKITIDSPADIELKCVGKVDVT